jgi:SH3-like domain-containing protein
VARLEVQANWVRVWIPESGRVAWVSRDAVQPDGGGNSVRGTVPFNALLPFRVIATMANLRESPDPKAEVVAELRHGTELRFLDARGGWMKVADPSRRRMGWIASAAVGRSY